MLTNAETFSGYSVSSIEDAKEFYGTKLGLATEVTKEGLQITTGNGQKVFLYEKPNHEPATFTVLNFIVDDIAAEVGELTSAGISMEHYPELHTDEQGIAWASKVGMGPDIAWFKDPAGNILSVLHKV